MDHFIRKKRKKTSHFAVKVWVSEISVHDQLTALLLVQRKTRACWEQDCGGAQELSLEHSGHVHGYGLGNHVTKQCFGLN